MIKILALHSSPRGNASNTLRLLENALEGTSGAGALAEIIDVTQLNIGYCQGDETCHRVGACTRYDDYAAVKEKMLDADGLILTTPCYVGGMTAQLKTVIDRSSSFVREQLLAGKYGFTIVTSEWSNTDHVAESLEGFIQNSGGLVTGRVSTNMARGLSAWGDAMVNAYDMGYYLVKAIEKKWEYRDQTIAHSAWKGNFGRIIANHKDLWEYDYELWVRKGWIEPSPDED